MRSNVIYAFSECHTMKKCHTRTKTRVFHLLIGVLAKKAVNSPPRVPGNPVVDSGLAYGIASAKAIGSKPYY